VANPRKKASNPPKGVLSSTMKIEDNQIEKVPVFNGNFDVWKVRMRNFLMAQVEYVITQVVPKSCKKGNTDEVTTSQSFRYIF